MSNNIVYIDCFYYGFYIKKSELKKYNITTEQVNNNNIIKSKDKSIKNNYNLINTINKMTINRLSHLLKISNINMTLNKF